MPHTANQAGVLLTQRVHFALLRKLPYCLHQHWLLLPDPAFSYEKAIKQLDHDTAVSLHRKTEVLMLLMQRHERHAPVLVRSYNNLCERIGWCLNVTLFVDTEIHMLRVEVLN